MNVKNKHRKFVIELKYTSPAIKSHANIFNGQTKFGAEIRFSKQNQTRFIDDPLAFS